MCGVLFCCALLCVVSCGVLVGLNEVYCIVLVVCRCCGLHVVRRCLWFVVVLVLVVVCYCCLCFVVLHWCRSLFHVDLAVSCVSCCLFVDWSVLLLFVVFAVACGVLFGICFLVWCVILCC